MYNVQVSWLICKISIFVVISVIEKKEQNMVSDFKKDELNTFIALLISIFSVVKNKFTI